MKKSIGILAVFAVFSGFAEYAVWPSDFDSKMAERAVETLPEPVVAVRTHGTSQIVVFAGGISGSGAYGTEEDPFDSGFMTSRVSQGIDFDSSKPVGMVIVLR